jgi:hypothetical protein
MSTCVGLEEVSELAGFSVLTTCVVGVEFATALGALASPASVSGASHAESARNESANNDLLVKGTPKTSQIMFTGSSYPANG